MNRINNKRKKTKKPLKKLFLLVAIFTFAFCLYKMPLTNNDNENINITRQTVASVDITENSSSPNSTISGQTFVKNADGYTTTFTTLNNIYQKTYTEYKQNQDASWADHSYWGGTMEENGCGITSLSIIASVYNINMTPEDFRKKYYPHLEATKISDTLNDLGIKCTDFYFTKTHLSKKYFLEWLRTNRPILICVDNTKENRWTSASHYMVLLEADENGLVYLSNPNGEDGSEKSSGWYSLNEILPYVVKALFIESY